MLIPALRVFVPGTFGARKPIDNHVGPAVLIEIVSVGKETLRIGIVYAQGPFEPGHRLLGSIAFPAEAVCQLTQTGQERQSRTRKARDKLTFESRRGGPDLVAPGEVR